MDYDEQVAGMMVILRGWIQNLTRNAANEGVEIEPAMIAEALHNLSNEWETLASGEVDDIDEYLRMWSDGRGTE